MNYLKAMCKAFQWLFFVEFQELVVKCSRGEGREAMWCLGQQFTHSCVGYSSYWFIFVLMLAAAPASSCQLLDTTIYSRFLHLETTFIWFLDVGFFLSALSLPCPCTSWNYLVNIYDYLHILVRKVIKVNVASVLPMCKTWVVELYTSINVTFYW